MCGGEFYLQTQIWIIPCKQMARPWHFSSPALLLPTMWDDHKNLFFPGMLFPCRIPEAVPDSWSLFPRKMKSQSEMAQAQLYSRLALHPHKGFLVLLRLGCFFLNVLHCSGLPESVFATQFKVTWRVAGLGRADFWAQVCCWSRAFGWLHKTLYRWSLNKPFN